MTIQPVGSLLTRTQAAEFIRTRYGHLSRSRLAVMAVEGTGPAYRHFGNRAVYEPADLIAWAEARLSEKMTSVSDLKGAA